MFSERLKELRKKKAWTKLNLRLNLILAIKRQLVDGKVATLSLTLKH